MMDGSTVATFHDGTSIATLKVENGQDLLEPGRNERKKAKKDERKRQKEARAEAERFIELVPDDLD
jgi:topoisomerase IA-like protein